MGAGAAVVVSDPALAGADALGTAKVLAAVVRHLGADLLLTATESSDGYTGTVPVQVAELLGWPACTYATSASLEETVLQIRRQTELGYDEVACELPAVVSVTAGAVEPRYPSLRGIMAARSKTIEKLTLDELGLDASNVGAGAARQEILSISPAPPAGAGEIVVDEGAGHEAILDALKNWKVI
jgi:electron transfer flavoprotein beta subunit